MPVLFPQPYLLHGGHSDRRHTSVTASQTGRANSWSINVYHLYRCLCLFFSHLTPSLRDRAEDVEVKVSKVIWIIYAYMNIIIYDNDIESHECLIAFIGNVGPELGKTDLQTCLFPLHIFIFYSPSLQVKANLAWQAEFRRFDTRDDKHRNPAGWTRMPLSGRIDAEGNTTGHLYRFVHSKNPWLLHAPILTWF